MSTKTLKFYQTSVGKKAVMALSGAVLLGFVFAHMAGNLLIFAGRDALNEYAISLRTLLGGGGIWVARLVLLSAVGAHFWSAMQLTKQNKGLGGSDTSGRRPWRVRWHRRRWFSAD